MPGLGRCIAGCVAVCLTAPVAPVLDHRTHDVPWVVPINHESGPIQVQWREFNHNTPMFVLTFQSVSLERRFLIVIALGDDKIAGPRSDNGVYDHLITGLKVGLHTAVVYHQREGTGADPQVRLQKLVS